MKASSQLAGSVCTSVADLVRLQYAARGLPLGGSATVDNPLVGHFRSSVRGRGMDFEELRQYRQGDDIRQMDWKVSNRTRKPHVRVYAEERERPVYVVVDQRLSMFFGSRRVMKSVCAAEVAALVGWTALSSNDRIGSVIFNDQKITEMAPRIGRQQIMQIFHQLEDFNQQLKSAEKGCASQLNRALKHLAKKAGHDALIYVISDLNGADDATGQWLSQLAQHNSVVLSFIYDPMEQSLPFGGELAVSDGQYQVDVDTNDPTLREQYSRQFEERLAQAREFLLARQVPVLPVCTEQPVAMQLRQMMMAAG